VAVEAVATIIMVELVVLAAVEEREIRLVPAD
jgi:hypothetical protein